jgi:hypothetical protein
MNYFDRQFLRAADFQVEQDYHVDRERRHAQFLHTAGIANGFGVTGNVGDATVTVQPGTALDDQGQLIVTIEETVLNLKGVGQAGGQVSLYVAFQESFDSPSNDPGVVGNPTRVFEEPSFAQVPPDAQPPHGVLVALLGLDGNGDLAAAQNDPNSPAIDTGVPHAGTVLGDAFTVRSLTLKNDGINQSQWPNLTCSNSGQASLAGTPTSSLAITDGTNQIVLGVDTKAGFISATTGNDLVLGSGQHTEGIRLTADGNVGIGIETPDKPNFRLEVANGNRKIALNAVDTTTPIGGTISFSRQQDAGYVFHMGGNATAPNTTGADELVIMCSGGGSEMRLVSGGLSSAGFGFYINTPFEDAFAAARPLSTLAVKIDKDGNVGIGGTSTPTAKLEVVGSLTISGNGELSIPTTGNPAILTGKLAPGQIPLPIHGGGALPPVLNLIMGDPNYLFSIGNIIGVPNGPNVDPLFQPGLTVNQNGDVNITGNLTKGTGSFKIDHPLDPANKYLFHSFVESPDMMNIYNGNITTDDKGLAKVILPAYFQALNGDLRYQLTVIGDFGQAIVAREVEDNYFIIKTDKPNLKVSWQVTGVRQDALAKTNPIIVEVDKPESERGRLLHAEANSRHQGRRNQAACFEPAETGGV